MRSSAVLTIILLLTVAPSCKKNKPGEQAPSSNDDTAPNPENPISVTFDFLDESRSLFITHRLSLENGVVSFFDEEIDQRDDEGESTHGFSAGTHNATLWNEELSQLEMAREPVNESQTELAPPHPWTDMISNVLYLPFDEKVCAGYFEDKSDMGHSAICSQSSCPDCVDGKLNGALLFDGKDDYIEILDSPHLDNTGKLTIEAWVYPTELDGNPRAIISKRVSHDDNQSFSVFFYKNNRLYVDIDGRDDRFFTVKRFKENQWYLISVTFDEAREEKSRVRVFVNGKLEIETSESSSRIPDYESNLYIGTLNPECGYFFAGKIDELSIYRKNPFRREAYFTSRVIDSGTPVKWSSLSWTPEAPYGKPLPDRKGSESLYRKHNISMKNNVALYHFDSISIIDGSPDSSGSDHHALCDELFCPDVDVNSRFGGALAFTGEGDYLVVSDSQNFDDTSTLTVEGWVYPEELDRKAKGLVSKRVSLNDQQSFSIFFYKKNCLYVDIDGNGDRIHTHRSFEENSWYHFAVVFDGNENPDRRVKIYVNGESDTEGFEKSQRIPDYASDFFLGILNYDHPSSFKGKMDEVAIYRRALSENEIFARWQRGVLRIGFQVRSCKDLKCSDTPFVGPEGTPNSFYIDSSGGPTATLNISENRYFQYRTFFHSDTDFSPALLAVEVGPTHMDMRPPLLTLSESDLSFTEILYFGERGSEANHNKLRYQISPDGSKWFYHDGQRWTLAHDREHANTITETTSNISDFHLEAGKGTFYFRIIFKSLDDELQLNPIKIKLIADP